MLRLFEKAAQPCPIVNTKQFPPVHDQLTLARTHHHLLIQFGQVVVVTGKRFEPIPLKVQNLLAVPNYHLIRNGKPHANN